MGVVPWYLQAVSRTSRTGLAALGGIAVGVVLAVLVIVGGGVSSRATPKPKPEATAEFVAAYERSLRATYVMKADYTRVLDNGRTLQSATFIAQRPPDRIQRQFGGITGTVAGRQIMCSTALGTEFHCGPAAPAPDSNGALTAQLANLQSYFVDPALYRVVNGDPGCFELTQVRPLPLAPYGSAATMCFDGPTGAMRYLEQQLEGAVDTLNATDIRSFATDQDFSLARDTDYDASTEGEAANLGLPTTTAPTTTTPGGDTTATTGG